MLETLEINSSQDVNASVIWLHGLGADGYDFEPIVAALGLAGIRYILPHAPYRKVTLNNGYEMRAWYDIYGLSIDSPQDEAGIHQTQAEIESLIALEKSKGIPSDRIVLAGFSQGGAIALHTALRHPEPLAAVLALSTYLPLKSSLEIEAHEANRQTPILMVHGSFDSVITVETAQISAQILQKLGYKLSWREYPMAHSVCNEEVADIRSFLSNILGI